MYLRNQVLAHLNNVGKWKSINPYYIRVYAMQSMKFSIQMELDIISTFYLNR